MAEEIRDKGKTGVAENGDGRIEDLKSWLQEKFQEQVEELKRPEDTQLYKAFFRVGRIDEPRNRALHTLNNLFLHIHPTKVNRDSVRYSYTWGMGGISFYLFLVLLFTGVMLMFYYVPSVDRAYQDISALDTNVRFGLLIRNMHRWIAHAMVLVVFLHMMRAFYTGAYKPPREFNWLVGVILLVLTLLLSFTGYLLPWDQLALWAITVGTNMIGYTPVFGQDVRFVLLGGAEIGPETLLRWYVLHVLFFPFITVIFMAIHFWRVRKDGGISGPL